MVVVVKYVLLEGLDWQLRFHRHIEVFDRKRPQVLLQVTLLLDLVGELLVHLVNGEVIGNQGSQQVS